MSNKTAARETATHWLWLVPPVVMADQLSKWLIAEYLELFSRIELLSMLGITRLHNTGAAFSFLANAGGWQRWFFVLLGAGVTVMILVWLRKLPSQGQGVLAAGLALVASGALGNVIDRVWHGYVLDFISVHYGDWYFPAFNIADIAITIGAGLLILDAALEYIRSRAGTSESK
ncbi:MAG: lipoprotein signal peptidase [Proteobacteria bacterium]|nr:lipoprotein signal peptidase [Pseudomonadota bacterium]